VSGRGFLLFLLGAAVAALLLRRRSVSRGEHVDVYFEDGSMISLEAGTPRAEELLALARPALARLPS
jgi:hypothetical protein